MIITTTFNYLKTIKIGNFRFGSNIFFKDKNKKLELLMYK